jgi:pimeloyl-ACP methyl ester carboxylesterase
VADVRVRARADGAAAEQMLWLPGAYHSHRDFLEADFAAAVRARRLDIDLIFADLEMDHLGDRDLLRRLREQLILPARAAGVRIRLGGISLGGLFALDYVDTHPGEIDDLCLLAPYLGNRLVQAEIAAAPRLADWRPGELAEHDVERRIWRHVQSRGPGAEPVHLGYGRSDRFAPAHALLARELPPACVDVIDGGHDWPTWTRLWENYLDSRPS